MLVSPHTVSKRAPRGAERSEWAGRERAESGQRAGRERAESGQRGIERLTALFTTRRPTTTHHRLDGPAASRATARVSASVSMATVERKEPKEACRADGGGDGGSGGEDTYGWGMRQVQVGLLFGALSMAYVFRINLSICIVEMTDITSNRPDVVFYDWNSGERGLILSSFFWGYTLTQVPAGILAVRFGPKWFLFAGVVACSLLSALTPLAAQWGGWQLVLAWRVMQGLVQGFIYPSSHAMLSRWVPPLERGRATAFVYNGISVGTVAGMAGAGWLSASPLGWPSGFWIPGVIGLVWGAAWILLAADSPSTCKRINPAERAYIERAFGETSSGQKKYPVPWRSIMTSVPMWALIIVHCGQNFGHWTLLTEMPTYMKQVLGFDIGTNALNSSLPYICLTISSLFVSWFAKVVNENGWLSLNVSRKTFQSVAHWGSGATMLVLGLVTVTKAWAIALLCVAVAFEAGTLTGYLCNHMDMSPNFGGAMMGVTNGLAALVAIIAPLLVSFITGDSEKLSIEEITRRWNIVFILAAAVYFVGNLLWVIFGSTAVQPWNTPRQDEEEGDLHPDSADTTATAEEHCK